VEASGIKLEMRFAARRLPGVRKFAERYVLEALGC
jgi:hypothetical protein